MIGLPWTHAPSQQVCGGRRYAPVWSFGQVPGASWRVPSVPQADWRLPPGSATFGQLQPGESFMKRVFAILFLAILTLGVTSVWAIQTPESAPATSATAAPSNATHFDVDTATTAYMDELSPAARAKSDAYFEGGYWLILWDCLWALGIAWLLLGTRLSARMRNVAERMTRLRWLQTAIYSVQYIILTTLLILPWNVYEGFVREHQYGLSTQNLMQWLGDQAKGLLVALVLGTIGLVVIYAVIRKATRTWWLWGAGVAIVFG